jgi:hypothetical protein
MHLRVTQVFLWLDSPVLFFFLAVIISNILLYILVICHIYCLLHRNVYFMTGILLSFLLFAMLGIEFRALRMPANCALLLSYISSPPFFFFFFFKEMHSHYVVKAGGKKWAQVILLPQPPE